MTFKTMLAPVMTAALALATPLAAQETEAPQQGETQQSEAPAQQSEAPQITAESLSEEQLDAFVEALVAIEAVRADYLPRIQQQESEAEQKAVIEEANVAAIEAVEGVDNMTPEQYMAIGKVAQQDEELNARILAKLEEAQNES
ncbi:uncharacterized protein DUF4168 [Roseovarius halotolerans]|uniref:DUF4168 domain-containing protein n=1 Tax=Roseovarius halotolerans TaxID=505353 RepID=A0A1X6ZVV1_9RHOB|nr:DUF4168 domain-containing protein [Roseovarius halotolerans]RKT27728.1 uncharacterized protein DUF4168 [Roseovarius halotolerans]SLN62391.1 hypothetical protein ROH8110_03523 [Roseovarius halotolerans]